MKTIVEARGVVCRSKWPVWKPILIVILAGFGVAPFQTFAQQVEVPVAEPPIDPDGMHAPSKPPRTSQEASERDHRPKIEEIIVEGERLESTLQESTHSIAVFNAKMLRRGTDRTLSELLVRVPNVTVDPFSETPVIRGLAQNGINTRGFAGAIPTSTGFMDGFFTPTAQPIWDASQVEVLKGTQNFLGGGNFGGMTSVSSNSGDEDNRIFTALVPRTGDRSFGAGFGGEVTESIDYRATAYIRRTDGVMNNLTRDDKEWNDSEEKVFRGRLDWQPGDSDRTNVMLRAEHYQTRRDGSGPVIYTRLGPVDPFERDVRVDADERNIYKTSSVLALITHELNDQWTVEFRAGWGDIPRHSTNDRDGTDLKNGTGEGTVDNENLGEQLRILYDSGDFQAYFRSYALRVDVDRATSDNFIPLDLDGSGTFPGITSLVRYNSPSDDIWFIGNQVGVLREFGPLSVSASLLYAGQHLDAVRGVASTRVSSTGNAVFDSIYDGIITNPRFFPQASIREKNTEYNLLPSVVVDYAFNDLLTVGAKYERGARLGGVWFNVARQTVNQYGSEKAHSWDLFFRATSLDHRFNLRANAFQTRILGQQIYAQLTAAPFDAEFVNAQRSHVAGVEVETSMYLDRWLFWFSAGWLETEFDKIEIFNLNLSGNEFPNAPEWTTSAGFLYDHPSGFFAAADISARPETLGSVDNRADVINEKRTLINARVGWEFERVEVSVFVRNLLDEKYLAYHDANVAFGGTGRFQTYVVGAPREVGLTLSVRL